MTSQLASGQRWVAVKPQRVLDIAVGTYSTSFASALCQPTHTIYILQRGAHIVTTGFVGGILDSEAIREHALTSGSAAVHLSSSVLASSSVSDLAHSVRLSLIMCMIIMGRGPGYPTHAVRTVRVVVTRHRPP